MGYKKICDEGVYEIWYGESEYLPWRVSMGGSGKYFGTLQAVARYIYGDVREETECLRNMDII